MVFLWTLGLNLNQNIQNTLGPYIQSDTIEMVKKAS